MKRRKPLRRKTWLRSRGNTSYRRRHRDLAHLRKVKTFPCVVPSLVVRVTPWPPIRMEDMAFVTPCCGPVQADHVGRRGLSRKGDDRLAISICKQHHYERENFSGTFKHYDQAMMRVFLADALALTNKRIEEREALASSAS